MKPAHEFFTAEEREKINQAVAGAEKRTAGEIVPVIAATSGRYGSAVALGGFLASIAALVLVWLRFQRVVPAEGGWEHGQRLAFSLPWIVLTMAAGFVLGVAVVSHVAWLRYLLAGAAEMRQQVERRAWEAFGRFGVGKTAGATGIVLYVSLFERMVSVQGDQNIASKLDQKTWEEVRDLLIAAIRERRAAEGFAQAIGRCGELLSTHFPIAPGDINELPNELRVLK